MIKVPAVVRIWILQALQPILRKATRLSEDAERHRRHLQFCLDNMDRMNLSYSVTYYQDEAIRCQRRADRRFAFVRWVRHLIGDI